MSSSMPHLQAVQRRMVCVVPVKAPVMRGAILLAAEALSPENMDPSTRWPFVAFAFALACLFSLNGWARTQVAHCASVGSFAPGGSVLKWAGAAGGFGDAFADALGDAVGSVVGPAFGSADTD